MSWLEDLTVDAVRGDLFAMDVDAIVCTTKVDGTLYGRTSKQLFSLDEQFFRAGIEEKILKLGQDKLSLGEAISLDTETQENPELNRFKRIILAALWDYHSEYTYNLIYALIVNSLRQAFAGKIKSLALPILNVDDKLFSQVTINVLSELNELKNSDEFSLEELIFVSDKENRVEFLNNSISAKGW